MEVKKYVSECQQSCITKNKQIKKMSNKSLKAVLIGATGPTGSRILGEVLKSKVCT